MTTVIVDPSALSLCALCELRGVTFGMSVSSPPLHKLEHQPAAHEESGTDSHRRVWPRGALVLIRKDRDIN